MINSFLYQERGGGWYGDGIFTLQATWPFALLTISRETVTLNVGWKRAELKIQDIVVVKRIFLLPFLVDGIRLVHKNSELPKLLLFWSFGHAGKIKEIIDSICNAKE